MNRLRTPWIASLTSALLAVGLLLSLVRPATVTGDVREGAAPVEWLRTQLAAPDDPLVEAALDHAAAAADGAPTLDAFVQSFAEAYLALAAPGTALADVFDVEAADEAVLDVLQRRYERLSAESLPVLLLRAAASAITAATQLRLSAAQSPAHAGVPAPHLERSVQGIALAPQVLTYAFRLYSSARPLGP